MNTKWDGGKKRTSGPQHVRYGNDHRMSEMRKTTAILPAALIESAMEASGANLTETLRKALRDYNYRAASRRLLAMRGQVRFELDWRALRGKGEDCPSPTPA